jgi:hypothetical protein
MTAIINGDSPSVTFSDGSTQATSAIVSGKVPYTNLPTGSVLQVVQGTLSSGYVSTFSSTYVTTGITATITPKFSTSKILMQFASSMYFSTNTGPAYTTFYRNSTNLSTSGVAGIGAEFFNLGNAWIPCSAVYLDSPATTSATTYAVYFRVSAGTSTVLLGGDNGMINSIVLMEIAG